MNREIKFRIWSVEDNEMIYEVNRIDIYKGKIVFYSNCELMQFTGVLDKNGKEIYEGDIVEWGYYIAIVKFENSRWILEDFDGNRGESFSGFVDEYKIIGNIFENPELREKK